MRRLLPVLGLLLCSCGAPRGNNTPDGGAECDPRGRTLDVPDFKAPFGVAHATIAPTAIDPASDRYPQARHELYLPDDPSVTLRDELFVMLPGTSNMPSGFEHVMSIAARAGYRVVGLAYDTDFNPAQLCTGVTGEQAIADCRTGVIVEKIHGTDETDVIDINEANSVEGRLLRLLRYASVNHPELGADRYYSGDDILWENIVVAGFSQGASVAGYIGKERALPRNILLAGGCDVLEKNPGEVFPMPWCSEPRATPPERTWGLMHLQDQPEADERIFELYGLVALGGFARADTGSPGYCTGSHALQTDLPSQGDGTKYHLSVAHDRDIPLDDDGVPLLAEDYYYLMTAD